MPTHEPRIVFWDLETLPNPHEVMKVYPRLSQYPGLTLKASITSIICAGYKWLGETTTHCINVWDTPRGRKNLHDDYDVVKALYDELIQADCIVTHNGTRFDLKFLQTRLLYHGLPPLPKVIHIDTCNVLRTKLMLFNNKLDTAGQFLVNERKLDNGGWDLWVQVLNGSKPARKKMTQYCKQDVKLLEKIFLKLRPLIETIPNYGLFNMSEKRKCPRCGSNQIRLYGRRMLKTKVIQRLHCKHCHSTFNASDAL